MFTKFLYILFILGWLPAYSQKSVLSTLGLGFVNGSCRDLYMTSTIGQVLPGTVTCDPYSVLIGFQQPSDFLSTSTYELVFNDVKLYPNPAKDWMILSGTQAKVGHSIQVKIMDMLGRIQQQFVLKEFNEIFKLDIHTLLPGIYSLVLTKSSREVQSILFIKK